MIGPVDDRCTDIVYTGGDRPPVNGLLDGANSGAAETWTYTCTRAVGLPAPPDTVDLNTARVVGVDPLGNSYAAEASAEVAVIDPSVNLVKSVSDNLVLVGSEVTYSFDVTNDGESPVAADDVLAEVLLVDAAVPALPTCSSPVLMSKTGGNGDDLLDRVPPEVWHYECVGTIAAPTTNLAVVRAVGGTTFGLRLPVFDYDAEYVQTFDPAISIEKTASPPRTVAGGSVTYGYAVRNTGDVPLAEVADRIEDDTCAPVAYVSGDQDEDGLLDTPTSIFEDSLDEVWIFTCATTVQRTTTNTVVVSGSAVDPEGEPLCDTSQRAALAAAPTCDPSAGAQATVVVGPPLPSSGGIVLWPLLALGSILVGIGAAALAAARQAKRAPS